MRTDDAEKDGLEKVLKSIVLNAVLVSLASPATHMKLGKLRLFELHGSTLFTSFHGRLMMGVFYTYVLSVDWLVGIFCITWLLIYINSTSKWMKKMIWYNIFNFFAVTIVNFYAF